MIAINLGATIQVAEAAVIAAVVVADQIADRTAIVVPRLFVAAPTATAVIIAEIERSATVHLQGFAPRMVDAIVMEAKTRAAAVIRGAIAIKTKIATKTETAMTASHSQIAGMAEA